MKFVHRLLMFFLFLSCSEKSNNLTNEIKQNEPLGILGPDEIVQWKPQEVIKINLDSVKKSEAKIERLNTVASKRVLDPYNPISLKPPKLFTPLTVLESDSIRVYTEELFLEPKSTIVGEPKSTKALPFRLKNNTRFDIGYLNTPQGLPNSYIKDLAEDHFGNVWAISYNYQLIKYNGTNFRTYDRSHGLNEDYKNVLHIDTEGDMWIGTTNGIDIYDGNNLWELDLGNINIHAIEEDCTGTIWVSLREEGLFRIKKNKGDYSEISVLHYRIIDDLESVSVNSILPMDENKIWIGTNKGIGIFDENTYTKVFDFQDEANIEINRIKQDNNGTIWFTSSTSLYSYDGESIASYGNDEGVKLSPINGLEVDSQGGIWVYSSDQGIGVLNQSGYFQIHTENGLNLNNVVSLKEGQYGNMLVGTFGGGIAKISMKTLQFLPQGSSAIDHLVLSSAQDNDGNFWFGTAHQSLVKYNGQYFDNYFYEDKEHIRYLIKDTKGNIWLATRNGVYMFDGSNFGFIDVMKNQRIIGIYEDVNGSLWFGTYNGVYMFDGTSIINYSEDCGLGGNIVNSITQDVHKRMWFATTNGITMFDGSSFYNYYNNDSSNMLAEEGVYFILINSDGDLFIDSAVGVAKIIINKRQKKSFHKIWNYKIESDPNPNISFLTLDRNDDLWVGSNIGVNRLRKIKGDEMNFKNSILHNQNDFQIVDGIVNIPLIDNQRKLWWGSSTGVKILDMNIFENAMSPPKIQLNEIRVNGEFIDFARLKDSLHAPSISFEAKLSKVVGDKVPFNNYPNSLILPHDFNNISFHYAAIDQNIHSDIKYQYKLVGQDNEWSSLSSNVEANFQNISYGDYIFMVRAKGLANIWSSPIEYPFTIQPIWWHTWWARILFILIMVSLVFGISQWRVLRAENMLREEQNIKAKINHLENRALRAQMNPHFIFNALNGIQSVMILEGEREANKYLDSFSKLLRLTLDINNSELVSLDVEVQYLNSYLLLEQMRLDENFSFSIMVSNKLDMENIVIPVMLFQPVVENAIVHGLLPKKGNRKVSLNFFEDSGYLVGEIVDNGIGRAAAAEKKKMSISNHASWASRIMNERIAINNSLFDEKQELRIIDLFENEQPIGTKVILKIPMRTKR